MYNNKSLIYILGAFVLGFLSFWVYSNLGQKATTQDVTRENGGATQNNPEEPAKPTASVTGRKSLDLSSQGLDKLPAYVTTRTDLEELDISNNKLTGALPSEIGKLKNLRVLIASNNLMTGVPAEIGQMPDLEILDLSNNQLTGLPNELANLKKLKVLNLSGNDYSSQDLEIIKKGLPVDTKIILE